MGWDYWSEWYVVWPYALPYVCVGAALAAIAACRKSVRFAVLGLLGLLPANVAWSLFYESMISPTPPEKLGLGSLIVLLAIAPTWIVCTVASTISVHRRATPLVSGLITFLSGAIIIPSYSIIATVAACSLGLGCP